MVLTYREIWNTVVSPTLVNLLSVFIIFVMIIFFKEPFLRTLGIWKGVEEYPIYCIVEPFSDPNTSHVHVDLFIINLLDKSFSDPHALSEELKKLFGSDEASRMDMDIKLIWHDGIPGRITKIEPLDEFNRFKGSAHPEKVSDEEWAVRLHSIKERGILRFRVYTNWQVPHITRASRDSVPFSLEYPGRI